ncbi:Uncharacterised protein [Vibrio cholerae]|nr:Uncharacterised protein [Vibrio cholerae]
MKSILLSITSMNDQRFIQSHCSLNLLPKTQFL